jgi:hypothetical protein
MTVPFLATALLCAGGAAAALAQRGCR